MDQPADNGSGNLAALSRGLHAAVGLVQVCQISCEYWHCVDRLGLHVLAKKLRLCLVSALSSAAWQPLGLSAPPEPALPCPPTDDLMQLFFSGAEQLTKQGRCAMPVEQLRDPLLQEAVDALRDVIGTQCIAPDPEASAEYRLPDRALFLLQNYWDGLHNILAATGSGAVGWDPHPLTRLIISLQERIRACLCAIPDDEINAAYQEAEGVIEGLLSDSADFDVAWECGWSAAASRFSVAIEKARLRFGAGQYGLTTAEQAFLGGVDAAVEAYRTEVAKAFGRMLKAADSHAERDRPQQQPIRTVAGYIEDVELALRRVVAAAYCKRYGESWTDVVRGALSTEELRDTEARLAREGQSDQDIVHLLNPQPLRRLVTSDWSITSSYFPNQPRKRINGLLDDWLSARTKSAHSRPEHLWPEIERQRARVACHDLLSSIAQEQRGAK